MNVYPGQSFGFIQDFLQTLSSEWESFQKAGGAVTQKQSRPAAGSWNSRAKQQIEGFVAGHVNSYLPAQLLVWERVALFPSS